MKMKKITISKSQTRDTYDKSNDISWSSLLLSQPVQFFDAHINHSGDVLSCWRRRSPQKSTSKEVSYECWVKNFNNVSSANHVRPSKKL